MADQQQKNAYLSEHLPYELKMLRYTSRQMHERQHYLTWNAHYESFDVHARNLIQFLSNDDKGNFKACEFVSNFSAKKSGLGTAMQDLTQQVFHLAKKRPVNPIDKFNTGSATTVCAWVEENFSDFLSELGKLCPTQRRMFDEKKADPNADVPGPEVIGPTLPAAPPSACSSGPVTTQTYTASEPKA